MVRKQSLLLYCRGTRVPVRAGLWFERTENVCVLIPSRPGSRRLSSERRLEVDCERSMRSRRLVCMQRCKYSMVTSAAPSGRRGQVLQVLGVAGRTGEDSTRTASWAVLSRIFMQHSLESMMDICITRTHTRVYVQCGRTRG